MIEVVQRTHADGSAFVVPASTASAYTVRTRQSADPGGYHTLGRQHVRIQIFGEGSSGQQGRIMVVGWYRDRGLWTPMTLAATGALTLSTNMGLAGEVPSEVQRWVDTIALLTGYGRFHNPGSGHVASVIAETMGAERVEVQTMITTATAIGALVART